MYAKQQRKFIHMIMCNNMWSHFGIRTIHTHTIEVAKATPKCIAHFYILSVSHLVEQLRFSMVPWLKHYPPDLLQFQIGTNRRILDSIRRSKKQQTKHTQQWKIRTRFCGDSKRRTGQARKLVFKCCVKCFIFSPFLPLSLSCCCSSVAVVVPTIVLGLK